MTTKPTFDECIQAAYDDSTNELKTTNVGTSAGNASNPPTFDQVIQRAYDPSTGTFRTVSVQGQRNDETDFRHSITENIRRR